MKYGLLSFLPSYHVLTTCLEEAKAEIATLKAELRISRQREDALVDKLLAKAGMTPVLHETQPIVIPARESQYDELVREALQAEEATLTYMSRHEGDELVAQARRILTHE